MPRGRTLPARDGVPHGGVKRSAPAPNCSFFTNWTKPDDRITWDIEVGEAGRYEAVLNYTCPAAESARPSSWPSVINAFRRRSPKHTTRRFTARSTTACRVAASRT